MAKRFIIIEHENYEYELLDKKQGITLFKDKSFDNVYSQAKKYAASETIYGITNIKRSLDRHKKFQTFKTPIKCSYEIESD